MELLKSVSAFFSPKNPEGAEKRPLSNTGPLPPFPITLTEKACEMVRQAIVAEALQGCGLRVGVVGGGCSGLQYLLDFAKEPTPADFVTEMADLRVFIDPYSASHLTGTEIDYVDDLQTAGFKFNNPNVTRACGCGSSFQTG